MEPPDNGPAQGYLAPVVDRPSDPQVSVASDSSDPDHSRAERSIVQRAEYGDKGRKTRPAGQVRPLERAKSHHSLVHRRPVADVGEPGFSKLVDAAKLSLPERRIEEDDVTANRLVCGQLNRHLPGFAG
jgi:hypothetical protein